MPATDVGKLRVVLAAETDRFNKQLEKSRKANTKLSKSMRGTARSAKVMSGAMAKLGALAGGALGARAIFNLGRETIALGDELAKTSKRLGIGIEALQVLQIEAKAAGIETEQLNKALAKFGVNVGEVAAFGIGEFKNALDRLGISLEATDGTMKSIDSLLIEFAQKMENVTSQNERLTLAADAFGTRAGPRMLEIMKFLAEGTFTSAEAAEAFGVATAGEVTALESLQDALDRAGKAWDTYFIKRFGHLAKLVGFDTEVGQLERQIAELEKVPRFLFQAANSGGDLVEKMARLRAELRALRSEAGGGTGINVVPPQLGMSDADTQYRAFLEGATSQGQGGSNSIAVGNVNWRDDESPAQQKLRELREDIEETKGAYAGLKDQVVTDDQLMAASISTVAGGLTNTLASALTGGAANFKEFARSAAESIAQIIIQQQIMNALSHFFPAAASGAVVEGGVKTFAAGGVVTKPTLFAMGGGGVGLMGEAGSEAIMPLKRDRAGRLGVSASGGQSPSGIVINVVNNSENSEGNDRRMARVIAQQVRAAWNIEARKQMQPGGTLNAIGSI